MKDKFLRFINNQKYFRFFLIMGMVVITVNILSHLLNFMGWREVGYYGIYGNSLLGFLFSWNWVYVALLFITYHKYVWRKELIPIFVILGISFLGLVHFSFYVALDLVRLGSKLALFALVIKMSLNLKIKHVFTVGVLGVLTSLSPYVLILFSQVFNGDYYSFKIYEVSESVVFPLVRFIFSGSMLYWIGMEFYKHKEVKIDEIGDLDF